jgi:hypothetical protein
LLLALAGPAPLITDPSSCIILPILPPPHSLYPTPSPPSHPS